MRKGIRLFAGMALLGFVVGEEPKKVEPPKAREPLKASVGVLRDGGTSVIEIPALGDQPSISVYIDGSDNSATRGEMFRRKDFARDRQGKQVAWDEADKILKQLEQVLIAHFGAEELLKIALNPISIGVHDSEADYGKQDAGDSEFSDRLSAAALLNEIIAYRTTHGPLRPK